MPWVHNAPSPWSRDGLPNSASKQPDWQMDPGQYDPVGFRVEDAVLDASHNRKRPAFDSTEAREFLVRIHGLESPGVMMYDAETAQKKLYPNEDCSVSAFRSTTPQRPSSKSTVPSPAHYRPRPKSALYRYEQNSGAHMRSAGDRFSVYNGGMAGQKSMTSTDIGPDSYDCATYRSLLSDCRQHMKRSSRLRPGFGTTTAQRALPFGMQQVISPGPGAYQRLAPRVRDLKSSKVGGHARI
eukprot:CAMPEP_0174702886 /NCGR_PEP_ID=MMETSP1094-20130205/7029_1 /TAXON_ID=156173 /ORGANISM="Chrysochromulina brevifilum, Strain UTEX LB 985" /LENGTH=239 /DNA_ID=CAMNT_0015900737 /DNA_START=12 /DNA_END=731 /DNA_ORIENTATION=-